MIQVKIFNVPEEVAIANEFLAKTPVDNVSTISKGEKCFILINYDADYKSTQRVKLDNEIKDFIYNTRKDKINTEVSQLVMAGDLIEYEAKLKTGEEELAKAEAETAPEDKKEAYDWEKAQGEKILKMKKDIEDIKISISNIKTGIEKGMESDKLADMKIAYLEGLLENKVQ